MLNHQLIIGSTYRVKFKSIFERHGYCTTPGIQSLHKGNGIFRLEQISTFHDVVRAGIKLYNNFFAPLGISEEDYRKYFDGKPEDEYEKEVAPKEVVTYDTKKSAVYDPQSQTTDIVDVVTATKKVVFQETGRSFLARHFEDSINYAHHPIYKFVDIYDALDVIYAPELTIDGVPEIDINPYKDLNLVLHLGVYDKPEVLDPLLVSIRDRLAVYGVRADSIKLYSTGTKWLSPEEFEEVKKIRHPAFQKVIGVTDRKSVLGRNAIIGNKIKKIVSTVNPEMVDGQVCIDSLTTKDQIIDNRLFIIPVTPDDTFANSTLLRKVQQDADNSNSLYEVIEPTMYEGSVGEPILHMVPVEASDKPNDGKRYYTRQKTVYSPVQPFEVREGQTYYYCKAVGTGSTEEEAAANITQEYIVASADQVKLYLGDTDSVDPNVEHPGTLYVMLNYPFTLAKFDEETTSFQEGTEYYKSKYGDFFKQVPATDEAVKLIGAKFTYKDENNMPKSIDLQLVDIIDIADTSKTVTLPGVSVPLTNNGEPITRVLPAGWKRLVSDANPQMPQTLAEYDNLIANNKHIAAQLEIDENVYKKFYARRKFRYFGSITKVFAGETEERTYQAVYETTLPDELTGDYAGMSGDIYGLAGSISRTTLILDTEQVLRNFWIQYQMANRQLEADRISSAALQSVVAKVAAENQSMREDIAKYDAKVAECNNLKAANTQLRTDLATAEAQLANAFAANERLNAEKSQLNATINNFRVALELARAVLANQNPEEGTDEYNALAAIDEVLNN